MRWVNLPVVPLFLDNFFQSILLIQLTSVKLAAYIQILQMKKIILGTQLVVAAVVAAVAAAVNPAAAHAPQPSPSPTSTLTPVIITEQTIS